MQRLEGLLAHEPGDALPGHVFEFGLEAGHFGERRYGTKGACARGFGGGLTAHADGSVVLVFGVRNFPSGSD